MSLRGRRLLLVNGRQAPSSLVDLVTLPPSAGGTDIVVFGNSITEGVGAGVGPSRAWPAVLGDLLEATYGTGTHGPGWVPCGRVSGSESWTVVNNSGTAGANGFSVGFGLNGIVLGDTDTATQSLTGNYYRVASSTIKDPLGLGVFTGGEVEIRVDGSLEATLETHDGTLTGTQAEFGKAFGVQTVVGPFAYGAHTIELRGVGSSQLSMVDGVFPYRQNYTSGVRVWNGGKVATQVGSLTSESARMLATIQPELVIVQYMYNDRNAASLAAYESDLSDAIDVIRGYSADSNILLVSEYQTSEWDSGDLAWADMKASMASIAASNGCSYFDLGGQIGSLGYDGTVDDPLDFLADEHHPDQDGHDFIASVYKARLEDSTLPSHSLPDIDMLTMATGFGADHFWDFTDLDDKIGSLDFDDVGTEGTDYGFRSLVNIETGETPGGIDVDGYGDDFMTTSSVLPGSDYSLFWVGASYKTVNAYETIFCLDDNTSGGGLIIYRASNGTMRVWQGGTQKEWSTSAVQAANSDGELHSWAVVGSGTSCSLYLDGVLVSAKVCGSGRETAIVQISESGGTNSEIGANTLGVAALFLSDALTNQNVIDLHNQWREYSPTFDSWADAITDIGAENHYLTDEASGTTLNDDLGNDDATIVAANATYEATGPTIDGEAKTALTHTGTADGLLTFASGHPMSASTSTRWTALAWVKFTDSTDSREFADWTGTKGIYTGIGTAGVFSVYADGSNAAASASGYNDDEWHLVAFEYNRHARHTAVFVDGVMSSTFGKYTTTTTAEAWTWGFLAHSISEIVVVEQALTNAAHEAIFTAAGLE